ncbi:ribosome assembly [Cerrena zonata]|uniref:Ribosome assembly n=1 Tax=Cerrena zonata TaxID=2478898 RepID=A0AAW0FH33_9APHY
MVFATQVTNFRVIGINEPVYFDYNDKSGDPIFTDLSNHSQTSSHRPLLSTTQSKPTPRANSMTRGDTVVDLKQADSHFPEHITSTPNFRPRQLPSSPNMTSSQRKEFFSSDCDQQTTVGEAGNGTGEADHSSDDLVIEASDNELYLNHIMATLVPPPSKKQKKEAQQVRDVDLIPEDLPNVLIKFQASDTGESVGGSIRVPGGISEKQLEQLLNQLNGETDEPVPYSFSLLNKKSEDDTDPKLIDINDNLYNSVLKPGIKTTEDFMTLVYTPRAVFKVKPISRSNAAIAGHGSTILCCQFAPNNSGRMCSGAGDSTARIWDCNTQTPLATLSGHTNWVLVVSYSPCGSMIATGSMDNTVRLWDAELGKPLGGPLLGHGKWISSLTWEPLHLVKKGETPRLGSGSKDGTVKIWDTSRRVCLLTMSGHTNAVSCVKWSGSNILYSGSHDKTIKAWDISANGKCIQTLKSHAHWVNHLSISTDYAMRKGGFNYESTFKTPKNQPQKN